MNVSDIKVTAVQGDHAGQSGRVSCWPMPEWGINVGWEDGTITTARPGEIIAPDEAAQIARHAAVEARLRQLARTSRRGLLAIVMRHARQRGASWVLGGPASWTRDELINGVLAFEFGEEDAS